ncbi:class I SAM-dependent DNA methyltransferase [Aeromicrobium sp. S22]|uniref:class I SAM-dependent DNA methyltransferase n=1 Tax=Aeromicrobium sp. S22 TaxID=2662029 RepID=UPI001E429068|nr:class I SAM-dependent DNA methyltransferase [Aeromicrobium sp. S22]
MPVSDALVVGEGWISEHYFTTDATKQSFQARVIERRKAWEEEKEHGTTRTRFTAARGGLLSTFVNLTPGAADRVDDLYATLRAVLGFDRPGLAVHVDGPVHRVAAAGMTGSAPLAIVHAVAVESVEDLLAKDAETLVEPFDLDETTRHTSVARTVSALFTAADHPDFVLVLAGRLALVAERERWAEGRYLLVDLQIVCERNDDKRGGEVDRALTCLDAASLAPDADGEVWWRIPLEESVRHTVGVSADLREGVRLSIEIIANEVVTRRRAKGHDPLPTDQAQVLARQSLRFLYRILFLLYAEASPELGVLPTGAPEYERGYSLDRLRDLTLVDMTNPQSIVGTHLYDSLGVLFGLVDSGHTPENEGDEHEGLTFRSLRADLFRPSATALIDETGLGNSALQQVLRHLLLSKESKGKDRGFISYAELGINQLGAVYEGLMSYTGFFAETDLFEVAKGGDASKGSWVVPTDRADDISESDFVKTRDPVTDELVPVLHERGTFVYRLAGRERQQSASYYTPEVLTRFVVSQALEELLDQDSHITTAAEILGLTVCEPALGSGAFAIEAVRQLADEYLKRRQNELGETIDPDAYPRELQKVKAYLALHQVYGVDLNGTAVELAEISLWLDTMVEGLEAPWFGLHLRRGNSLIGARRAVYSREQVSSKSWLKTVPRDVPMSDMPDDVLNGRPGGGAGSVHHFLLPAEGWGSAVDAKEAKTLAPEAMAALKQWRKSVAAKPTKKQTDQLIELGYRVEALWQLAWQRLQIAEREIRRSVDVWGADDLQAGGAVTREQIEESLADANGAYRRLRRVMDAWTALWFWPLTATETTIEVDGVDRVDRVVQPPTFDQWIDALQKLLGRAPEVKKPFAEGQMSLASASSWEDLAEAEDSDRRYAGAVSIESLLAQHPWLVVCDRIAERYGFFHWELDFAPTFAAGGFDLQVGNPPWVRPTYDAESLLAEGDPWWQLRSRTSLDQIAARRRATLELPRMQDLLLSASSAIASTSAFLGAVTQYPQLARLQPDLYRCFMLLAWRNQSKDGSSGLVHPESHFTDAKAGLLRSATYLRLRRHWQFINELSLFEIHHLVSYGVHVYGAVRERPDFISAYSLYHPDTAERSLAHNGLGAAPGLKNEEGRWDVRPHRERLIRVTSEVISTWHALLEQPETPVLQSRTLYVVNQSSAAALAKLAKVRRLEQTGYEFSMGWHEVDDRRAGLFDVGWGTPERWRDVILMGPHIHVATPFYKAPNRAMANNLDWSRVDLEKLAGDAVPTTTYKRSTDQTSYDANFPRWRGFTETSPRDYYRVAWRSMAASTGERTLIPALIPPGAVHLKQNMYALGFPQQPAFKVVLVAGLMSSLIADFLVRAVPKSSIPKSLVGKLPFGDGPLADHVVVRALLLNSVTSAYGDLYNEVMADSPHRRDAWSGGIEYPGRRAFRSLPETWTDEVPLRRASDRRQALVEIDAIAALMFGLSADELCTIYRTQFSVLYGYDRNTYYYDANGRLVPNGVLTVWRKKRDSITEEERTARNQAGNTYTYELPFVTLDREADMRQAYAHFEKVLSTSSSGEDGSSGSGGTRGDSREAVNV